MVVYAISGKCGSGKSTVGRIISSRLGLLEVAFADNLKKVVEIITGEYPHDKTKLVKNLDMTNGQLLQCVGETMRTIDKDIWIKSLIVNSTGSDTSVVITDLRYPNELHALQEAFPDELVTIRVNRPDSQRAKFTGNRDPNHPSETGLDSATFDYTIENDADYQDLLKKVTEII